MGKSRETKLKFAEILELLMESNPVSKISVSDIVSASGLSRQTFYRHFIDIFDLINWMHKEKNRLALEIFNEYKSLESGFLMTLKLIMRNKRFYSQIALIEGPNSFSSYYCSEIFNGILSHIGTENVEDEIMFAIRLYAIGATQQIQEWIKGKMILPPEQLAKFLARSIPVALLNYPGSSN